jgi:predicted RNA-binding Zn ribbon-like protein
MNPDIDLVLAFLQTRLPADQIASPGQLQAWLVARGFPAPVPTPEEFSETRHLRAALLNLLLRGEAAWDDVRTREAIEVITRSTTLAVAISHGGVFQLVPADPGVRGVLATIIGAFDRIAVRAEIHRLKACAACGWAFFDVSKNNSRRWCDMAVCGSQQKSREYRKRHAAQKHSA